MTKRSFAIAAALMIGLALPAGLAKAERLSASSVGGAAGAGSGSALSLTDVSLSMTLNRLPPTRTASQPSIPTPPSLPSLPAPTAPSLPAPPK